MNQNQSTCLIEAILCRHSNDCHLQIYPDGSGPMSLTDYETANPNVPQISVVNNDGPIQVWYPGIPSLKRQTVPITPLSSEITFTAASLASLNISSTLFESDTANNRIVKLQTIGQNYEKTWLYTNKLVYLQAQYWPLVWASAGLLRPKIDSAKLVLIDFMCPARPNSLELDIEVNYYFT